MNKRLFYAAMKKMPSRFVDEKTEYTIFCNTLFLANPKFAPVRFTEENKKWERIPVFKKGDMVNEDHRPAS